MAKNNKDKDGPTPEDEGGFATVVADSLKKGAWFLRTWVPAISAWVVACALLLVGHPHWLSHLPIPLTPAELHTYTTAAIAFLAAWSVQIIINIYRQTLKLKEAHAKVRLDLEQYLDPEGLTDEQFRDSVQERLRSIVRRKDNPDKPIVIDLIAVSMKWTSTWLERAITETLKKDMRVDLRIVFVSPALLQQLNMDCNDDNWAEESRNRVTWIKQLFPRLIRNSKGRLRVRVRLIDNLPHWHGILIEREFLYLGRVSWKDNPEREHDRPVRLTCAENGYRRYIRDETVGGAERVNLFRRWIAHYCNGAHTGEWILRPDRGKVIKKDGKSISVRSGEDVWECRCKKARSVDENDEIDFQTQLEPGTEQLVWNVSEKTDFLLTIVRKSDPPPVALQ